MQKFIAKYALAAHLAVLAVAPLFLSPSWVVWFSAAGALWLFMEPSKINGENLRGARKRVSAAVSKDPVFWLSLTLLAYYLIVLCNSGVALSYDAEAARWFMSSPPMPLLPSSASGYGAEQAAGLLALTVVVQGCRHALGKNARFGFMAAFSFLSGLTAFLMTGAILLDVESVVLKAGCAMTDPQFIGSVFGVCSMVAAAALSGVFETRIFRMAVPVLIGLAGSTAGLFIFAPSYVVFAFACAHAVLFLYSFVYARRGFGTMTEFKYAVLFFIALALAAVTVFFALPEEMLDEKLTSWMTGDFLPGQTGEAREILSKIAFSSWRDNPWLGTGLGTFALDIKFNAPDSAYLVISELQSKPLNGYWLLLAEHGITGTVLYACLYGAVLFSYVHRLCRSFKGGMSPPVSLAGVLALAAFAFSALFDCSFLMPGAIVVLCSLTALSAVSFSKGGK